MKKLWNRTRSRSRRESAASNTKTTTTGANETPPPVPSLPRVTQTSSQYQRPSTENRVQPVLVGVSRPGDSFSRPGTAGSLQNAVSRAADQSSQTFLRGHTRTQSPRYVDIFSISSTRVTKTDTSTSFYNEDIAERNIDPTSSRGRSSLDYVPGSKYQEEVAVRNSYQSQSSDGPRSSTDRNHRSWISSGTESGPSQEQTPHTSWSNSKFQEVVRPRSSGRNQHAYSSLLEHRPVSRSGDGGLDQKKTDSLTSRSGLVSYNLSHSEVPQPRYSDQAQQNTTRSSSRLSGTSTITPTIVLPHRTIMDLTEDQDSPASEKQVEFSNKEAEIMTAVSASAQPSEDLLSSLIETPKVFHPATERNPSNPAQLKASDRTVARPPDADPVPATNNSHEPKPTPKHSTFSTINTVASSQPTEEKQSDKKTEEVLEPVKRDHVASQLAPVPAKYRLSTVEETESETEEEDATESSAKAGSNVTVPNLDGPSDVPAKAIVQNTDGSNDISTKHSVRNMDGSRNATTTQGDVHVADGSSDIPTAVVPNTPKLAEPEACAKSQAGTTQSTPAGQIHYSPASLQSADFTNPSAAFGVRARDFAVTPSRSLPRPEQPSSPPAKVDKQLPAKEKAPVASIVNGGPVQPSAYTFDEDAFRRKQEQARAALIKLQQSLNEEFLPPPRNQAAARPNRLNSIGQRRVAPAKGNADPNGPVAPSSIFAQPQENVESSARPQANGVSHSTSHVPQVRPRLSSHNSGSSASTVRISNRGTARQPLQQSQPNMPPRSQSADVKGKGRAREREIDVALYELQRAAEQIAGAARPASAQARTRPPPQSPLRERRADAPPLISGMPSYERQSPRRAPTSASDTGPTSPRSPGAISLSHFPQAPASSHYYPAAAAPSVPTGPKPYTHTRQGSSGPDRDGMEPRLKRRGSTTSQASAMTSTSQYSIPFHMIPERGSSMRDAMVRDEDL
jgi:hypothetical protein